MVQANEWEVGGGFASTVGNGLVPVRLVKGEVEEPGVQQGYGRFGANREQAILEQGRSYGKRGARPLPRRRGGDAGDDVGLCRRDAGGAARDGAHGKGRRGVRVVQRVQFAYRWMYLFVAGAPRDAA